MAEWSADLTVLFPSPVSSLPSSEIWRLFAGTPFKKMKQQVLQHVG
jgi:hypothetical protein